MKAQQKIDCGTTPTPMVMDDILKYINTESITTEQTKKLEQNLKHCKDELALSNGLKEQRAKCDLYLNDLFKYRLTDTLHYDNIIKNISDNWSNVSELGKICMTVDEFTNLSIQTIDNTNISEFFTDIFETKSDPDDMKTVYNKFVAYMDSEHSHVIEIFNYLNKILHENKLLTLTILRKINKDAEKNTITLLHDEFYKHNKKFPYELNNTPDNMLNNFKIIFMKIYEKYELLSEKQINITIANSNTHITNNEINKYLFYLQQYKSSTSPTTPFDYTALIPVWDIYRDELLENLKGSVRIYINERPDVIVNGTVENAYYEVTDNCLKQATNKTDNNACDNEGKSGSKYQNTSNIGSIHKMITNSITSNVNLILFGYGFSGSGKTYTFVGENQLNKKGIIHLFIDECISSNYTLKLNVFESYLEVDKLWLDFERYTIPNVIAISLEELTQNHSKQIHSKITYINDKSIYNSIGGDTETSFNKIYKNIEDTRIKNKYIKMTKNNPVSSRGHLFFKFTVTDSNDKSTNITFIDMAGSETPEDIIWHEFKDFFLDQKSIFWKYDQKKTPESSYNFTFLQELQMIHNKLEYNEHTFMDIVSTDQVKNEESNKNYLLTTLLNNFKQTGNIYIHHICVTSNGITTLDDKYSTKVQGLVKYSSIIHISNEKLTDEIVQKMMKIWLLQNHETETPNYFSSYFSENNILTELDPTIDMMIYTYMFNRGEPPVVSTPITHTVIDIDGTQCTYTHDIITKKLMSSFFNSPKIYATNYIQLQFDNLVNFDDKTAARKKILITFFELVFTLLLMDFSDKLINANKSHYSDVNLQIVDVTDLKNIKNMIQKLHILFYGKFDQTAVGQSLNPNDPTDVVQLLNTYINTYNELIVSDNSTFSKYIQQIKPTLIKSSVESIKTKLIDYNMYTDDDTQYNVDESDPTKTKFMEFVKLTMLQIIQFLTDNDITKLYNESEDLVDKKVNKTNVNKKLIELLEQKLGTDTNQEITVRQGFGINSTINGLKVFINQQNNAITKVDDIIGNTDIKKTLKIKTIDDIAIAVKDNQINYDELLLVKNNDVTKLVKNNSFYDLVNKENTTNANTKFIMIGTITGRSDKQSGTKKTLEYMDLLSLFPCNASTGNGSTSDGEIPDAYSFYSYMPAFDAKCKPYTNIDFYNGNSTVSSIVSTTPQTGGSNSDFQTLLPKLKHILTKSYNATHNYNKTMYHTIYFIEYQINKERDFNKKILYLNTIKLYKDLLTKLKKLNPTMSYSKINKIIIKQLIN